MDRKEFIAPIDRCEKCEHYNFIDSAYGECRGSSPLLMKQYLRTWSRWPYDPDNPDNEYWGWKHNIIEWINRLLNRWQYHTRYPSVTWCDKKCAKYQLRKVPSGHVTQEDIEESK